MGTKGMRKFVVECPNGQNVMFQFSYVAGNNNGTYRGSPHRTVPHRTNFSIRRFLKYFNSSHSTDYYVIKFHIVRFLQYLYTLKGIVRFHIRRCFLPPIFPSYAGTPCTPPYAALKI